MITEVTLALLPMPATASTGVACFSDLGDAGRAVALVELLAMAGDGGDRRRLSLRRLLRTIRPEDEPDGLERHLNDRPAPVNPGASGAGRPEPEAE